MNLAVPCSRCGRVFTVAEHLAGRKVRCQTCGQVQRIPTISTKPADNKPQPPADVYALAPELPAYRPERTPTTQGSMPEAQAKLSRRSGDMNWRRLIRAGARESSVLEMESLALIALSAADLFVTYALLRRGPAFYESNPVAQWFFVRWNIAGMALFKFGAMGLVVAIGEVVERHRPGWGRCLLLVSCLATLAVVVHGLRLLFGHEDTGAPLL